MFRVLNAITGEAGFLFRDKKWRFETSNVVPEYVLIPAFFNAHTHIGDSFFEAPRMPLESLVGPESYKFRRLEQAEEDEIVEGMKRAISVIAKTSSTSLEFREDGLRGYELYMRADNSRMLIALSRPSTVEEAEILSEISHGFNFSSVRDHDYRFLEECRDIARKKGLIFAIHAGEINSLDVENAIALDPDFLIHMNMAEKDQIIRAMDHNIGIVTCFRSNAFFGVLNPENYIMLSEYDGWHIGTDNCMITTPSMIDELKFASYLVEPEKLFRAGIRNPFFESYMLLSFERIVDRDNVVVSVVRRMESCDVFMVIREEIEFE